MTPSYATRLAADLRASFTHLLDDIRVHVMPPQPTRDLTKARSVELLLSREASMSIRSTHWRTIVRIFSIPDERTIPLRQHRGPDNKISIRRSRTSAITNLIERPLRPGGVIHPLAQSCISPTSVSRVTLPTGAPDTIALQSDWPSHCSRSPHESPAAS